MGASVPLVKGEMRLELKEARNLGQNEASIRQSGRYRIGGLDWYLETEVRRRETGTVDLGVYGVCNARCRRSRGWSCSASVTFRLQASSGQGHSQATAVRRFTGGRRGSWGKHSFVRDWPAVCDSKPEYFKDNCVVIKATVEIFALRGIRHRPYRDFRVPDDTADIVLSVVSPDDRKTEFHVSKASLALHSAYFDSLFYGSFRENAEDNVSIKDIVPEDFHNLLQLLYGGDGGLSEESAEALTKLAHRLSLDTVLGHCEAFLVRSTSLPYSRLLQLADQCQLWHLQEEVLEKMPVQQMKAFRLTDAFEALSSDSKVPILEKICSAAPP